MPWVLRSLRTWGVGWAPLASHSRIRSSLRTIVEGWVWGLYWPTFSMKRPSRGERWSATTTRQIGSFLPPTRVSLSRTANGSSSRSAWKSRRERVAGASERRPAGASEPRPAGMSGRARRSAPAAHERTDVGHVAPPDLAHELAHLVELLDQLVDRLDVGPRALGDAQAPRALDELGAA